MNGSRTLTVGVEGPMIPTQPPAPKRKATDDANPLAATAGKKLKREVSVHIRCLLYTNQTALSYADI